MPTTSIHKKKIYNKMKTALLYIPFTQSQIERQCKTNILIYFSLNAYKPDIRIRMI